MNNFQVYIRSFRSFNAIASKAALVAPPALAGLSNISPPWPDTQLMIGFFISILELVAAMYIFSRREMIIIKIAPLLRNALIMVGVSLSIYLTLFAFLVLPMESESHLDVIGFMFQQKSFATYPVKQLLASFGYDPLAIWVPWSVYVCRIGILISWITFYVSVACFFGLFYLKLN